MGLLDLLGGGDQNAINQTYGVPQGVVDNANSNSLLSLGGLLMAAGQRMTPMQRAQYLSQLGGVANERDNSIYKGSQAYLMGKKAQEPKETFGVQKDDAGNLFQVSNTTGERKLLHAAPDPTMQALHQAQLEALKAKPTDPGAIETAKEQAKQKVANDQKAAIEQNDYLPALNNYLETYKKAAAAGAVGPVQSNPMWRSVTANSEKEALRQQVEAQEKNWAYKQALRTYGKLDRGFTDFELQQFIKQGLPLNSANPDEAMQQFTKTFGVQEKPPMAGATKAPDGKWYVKHGNGWARVD